MEIYRTSITSIIFGYPSTSCDDLCPSTCAELSSETECVKKCANKNVKITGCFCSNDLLLQDGVCIPTSKCRCLHQGNEYQSGIHLINNCKCKCHNGLLDCSECDEDASNGCKWSTWSSWSLCFTEGNKCDASGVQHRFRSGLDEKPCKGESSQSLVYYFE